MDRAEPGEDPLALLLALPGIAAGVQNARDAVDGMLSNRMLRRRSGDVSTESALRGAWASAVLSGSTVSLAQVREGSSDPVVQGALRAQSELGPLGEVWRRAPRQALARLHAVAAADLAPADVLGRPTAAADRMDTLAAVLTTTSAPAVVVAGVVHGEILSLDAFAPVSGLVARVAVRLTLIARGLDPKSLVVVEAGHRDLGNYETALDAYRTGTPDGIGTWLVHCADAVAAGARETVAICEALRRG